MSVILFILTLTLFVLTLCRVSHLRKHN